MSPLRERVGAAKSLTDAPLASLAGEGVPIGMRPRSPRRPQVRISKPVVFLSRMQAHPSPAHRAFEGRPRGGDDEQRLLLHGVSWKDCCVLRELLDSPGLRMTYLEGALELMTPSPLHEVQKKSIARLLELFAIERNVPLYGYGSTTFKSEAAERGLEPDECYVVGGELRDVPDIALGVVVKSGGLDKLKVYQGLGVREVWLFEHGRFALYGLGEDGYRELDTSEFVPGLDFELLATYAVRTDQHEAVMEFRDRLRSE
jgi:Uma2 family endonuclease